MAMNRGEWSEFYAILSLLENPDMNIANERLEDITSELYHVKQLTLQERETIIDYVLRNDLNVSVYFNDEIVEEIDKLDIKDSKQKLFNIIKNAAVGNGVFEINNVQELLNKMTPTGILKSKSSLKEDLNAVVIDRRVGDDLQLKYSIKSSLGSPATILNASNHTNFIYEVEGIKISDINKINNIDTRTKLIDRIKIIKSLGGNIRFSKMECQSFDYNLRLIDSNMPKYLGDVLLNSYEYKNKNLKDLFLKNSNFSDDNFALKKLGDFLDAISFGLFPSIKWDGINNVNGGLIIVKKDGKVVILDLIYFRQNVINYLIEETKLDSPSSKRYNMMKLYIENDRIYFKLNLQIRYKK
ncbi:MAG: HpaII family restriction endonuclease [Bacilli bacterium]